MPLVLGVDSSTQSCKVEVRDADTGALVARGMAPHPPTSPPRSEQHPEAWWDALVRAVTDARASGGWSGDAVGALSVAAQQHGLVVLDAAGEVVRPAKLWNDVESAPHAARLVDTLGADRWARACGSVPVASFTITKLAWLREHEPASLARAATVMLPHDWITHRLCAETVTDRGDASGTGYWCPSEGRWRIDLLGLVDPGIDWAPMLPRVCAPDDVGGRLTRDAAHALGLRPGIVVAAGTGDNMAAALGLGMTPGDLAVSVGTSGTVYAVSAAPIADASGAIAGFASADGGFLPLACVLNAGKVLDSVARLLGVTAHELGLLAGATPRPDSDDLLLIPYFDGERTPNLPDATGTIVGLRTSTTRNDLARSAFEGVACSLLECRDLLLRHVETPRRTLLVGGWARSGALAGLLADLAGVPIAVSAEDEVVAAGACVQAAAVLTQATPGDVAQAWRVGAATAVDPTMETERAAALRARWTSRRDALFGR